MRIRKMTATFGGLEQAVLEPGPGLTVFSAPNEGGKSTWAGFLKAMLYGVDTRERDKTGFLAEKTRYAPWSGAPMSGEVELEWEGKNITLRRYAARSGPFGGFEAVYTATGDPVPGLTAANVGEKLTGVSREVFLRSAFVQGGAAIGHSGELEARIAALATSGEEDAAYSDVERTLKDWRNRRRANRSNGLIPRLEEERGAVEAALADMAETRRRRTEGRQTLERLERRRQELQADLELWGRIERHELNRRYGEAYREWEEARAALPDGEPYPVFGTMTGEEAWAFAQEQQEAQEAARAENRRRKDERGRIEASWRKYRIWVGLFAGVLAVAVLLSLMTALWSGRNWTSAFAGTGSAVLLALVFLVISPRIRKDVRRRLEENRPIPVPEGTDWLAQAAAYRETLASARQARAAEAAARRRVDDLAAQGGRLYDTLEMLYPPVRSRAETAALLSEVEDEMARVRQELASAQGALAQLGDPEDAEARRDQLTVALARRLDEYDGLTTALDALSAANAALRERFSPALNREAGRIFAQLTAGRWDGVTLARDFTAQARAGERAQPRTWLALSAGTAEQLYLAVRLAVCVLTMPDAPLVLDDALADFDDARCALALDCLKGMAGERQILLFTCHSREGAWARAHGVPAEELYTSNSNVAYGAN